MSNGSKLERLRVKGFKSFSKRTSLLFSPGITAIVGPNGSGKSNVLDAISFVMGSLSFSSLRAKSASSLIHMGKTKKSVSAEVELEISVDNSIAEEGHIKLSRKLVGDGTSIYRINGRRSTRLAMMDAMASINIFPDGHNIVHQGAINKFVNMTPRERRELIEVVAGIGLYEKKKERAIKDLEDVDLKIDRVEAIHGERMRIYGSLRDEINKVHEFDKFKKLEARARYSLLLKKIENLRKSADNLAADKKIKETEATKLEELVSEKLKELNLVSSELETRGMKEKVNAMTQLEGLRMELKRIDGEESRAIQEIESSKNRLSSIQSQLDGLTRRSDDITAEIEEKKERHIILLTELKEYKKHRDETASRVAESRQAYERRKKEFQKLKEKKDQFVLKSKELSLEKNSLEHIVFELEKKLANEKRRKLSLEAEKRKFIDEKKKSEKEFRSVGVTLKAVSRQLKDTRKEEKEMVHSSNLPAGVRKLQKKGYKLLGEVVKDPTAIMPFAFSVLVSKKDDVSKEIEDGWVFAIPEDFDIEKLKEVSKLGIPVGKITRYAFQGEGARTKKIEIIRKKLDKLEKEEDGLRVRKAILEGKLNQDFDPLKLVGIDDILKSTKADIKERKKRLAGISNDFDKIHKKVLEMGELKEPTIPEEKRLEELSSKVTALESEELRLSSELTANEDSLKNLIAPDIVNYQKLLKGLADELKEKQKLFGDFKGRRKTVKGKLSGFEEKVKEIEELLKEDIDKKSGLEKLLSGANSNIYILRTDSKIIEVKIENILEDVKSCEESKPEGMMPVNNPTAVLKEVLAGVDKLGSLNFRASEEFDTVRKLVKDISERMNKLREEKESIIEMMNEIEKQKRSVFIDVFTKINDNFGKIFSEVIDGKSWLDLDSEDPFDSGIYIRVVVHGREMPPESLSGGQKTLAAIALIFAIQEVKPSPFYIFDEVDAALDKTNSEKFARMIRKMSDTTQTMIITHNDTVVMEADQIVGVYMNRGISQLLSLPKEKVLAEADSWIGK